MRSYYERLNELNASCNEVVKFLLNEVPDILSPQYRHILSRWTNKIPHDQNGEEKKISEDFHSPAGKLRLFKNHNPGKNEVSVPDINFLNTYLHFIANAVLLSWPKTTINNLFNLYYFFQVSKPSYVPKLSQLSKWTFPEEKSDNVLGRSVKSMHQSFQTFQLVISSVEQTMFLMTLQNIYPFYQQCKADNDFDNALEKGYASSAIDLAWYCSVAMLIVNSSILVFYLQQMYLSDLYANVKKCLPVYYSSLSEKINRYIQSEPWDSATYEARQKSYKLTYDILYQEPDDEKNTPLQEAYSALAFNFYNDVKSALTPWLAMPLAKSLLKLAIFYIGSKLLPLMEYLIDFSKCQNMDANGLSYGLIPLIYDYTNLSYLLNEYFDDSHLNVNIILGLLCRHAEILLYAWLLYPVFLGFFQAFLERIIDLFLVNPEETIFKKNLADVTRPCLESYYFNPDEVKKFPDDEKNDNPWEVILSNLACCVPAAVLLNPVGNMLTCMTNMIRHAYPSVIQKYLNDISYLHSRDFMSYVDGSTLSSIIRSYKEYRESNNPVPPLEPQASVIPLSPLPIPASQASIIPLLPSHEEKQSARVSIVNAAVEAKIEANAQDRFDYLRSEAKVIPESVVAPAVVSVVENDNPKNRLITELENYKSTRSKGKSFEWCRFIMTKQRKIDAANSILNFLEDGIDRNLKDATAFSNGELGKIINRYRSFLSNTSIPDKIVDAQSTCCLVKCFS